MIIDTKYNVGDKVKYMRLVSERQIESCGFCGGSGEVTGQNFAIRTCPECDGIGHFWHTVDTKKESVGTITGISVQYASYNRQKEPDIQFIVDRYNRIPVSPEDIISLQN